jgi:toxin ParE1/3/4
MWNLIVRQEAENDLIEAYQWYEQQYLGLGESFLKCVETSLDSIRNNPDVSTQIYKNLRRKLIRRFPYGIFYAVSERTISIVAVMHAKRCPKNWKIR